MSNKEKYIAAFKKVFPLKDNNKLAELKYQDILEWDSVGHMELITELEDAFDIEFETDDIIDFSSFKKGIEILADNYGIKIND